MGDSSLTLLKLVAGTHKVHNRQVGNGKDWETHTSQCYDYNAANMD